MKELKTKRWIDIYKDATKFYNISRSSSHHHSPYEVYWNQKPYHDYALPGTQPIPTLSAEELTQLEDAFPASEEELLQLQLVQYNKRKEINAIIDAHQEKNAEKVIKRATVIAVLEILTIR